ncbi:hypothetical protein D1839_04785 [Roseburia sp. 1XD42-34]|nr:hypothetical protein [Roseburia sp. 1XD42-34]RKI80169.1 hypothetical protein D7V87_04775 [Clostridium sp. 1xD42-85]
MKCVYPYRTMARGTRLARSNQNETMKGKGIILLQQEYADVGDNPVFSRLSPKLRTNDDF